MNNLSLLYIEDNEEDVKLFADTIKRYNKEHESEKKVTFTDCRTVEEARKILSNRENIFDGVIIDIKLNNTPGEGNRTTDIIKSLFIRIPCIAYTATPDDVNSDLILKKFTKATSSIDDVLDYLYNIQQTGLNKLLGTNGLMEEYLSLIYGNNIKPNLEHWMINAQEQPDITVKALLRHVSYCITELINKEYEQSLTDEFYITPPLNQNLKTGSVIKSKNENDEYYIILSPECDMVLRQPNNKPKTDNILICTLDNFYNVTSNLIQGITNEVRKIRKIGEIIKNNYTEYYHFMPKCTKFDNKLINFRKVSTISFDDLIQNYEQIATVSGSYCKDILCRFSTYYARQGQPDFHFENIAKNILKEMQASSTTSTN